VLAVRLAPSVIVTVTLAVPTWPNTGVIVALHAVVLAGQVAGAIPTPLFAMSVVLSLVASSVLSGGALVRARTVSWESLACNRAASSARKASWKPSGREIL
jgi:hypothetical protein